MHEKQPRFDRRKFLAVTLGGLASAMLAPEVSTAPDIDPEMQDAERITQAEIDELEANLYETARTYGLSLAPEDDIHEAFYVLQGAVTENEAFSIVSTFTERQFGFPVNDLMQDNMDMKTDAGTERLLSFLSLLPREVYEAIDLDKIDIGVPYIDAPRGNVAVASFSTYDFYSYEKSNTITFFPGYSDVLKIVLHEVSHGLDYMSRLDGSEDARRAADDYLNDGRESEYIAELSAAWMMGDVQRNGQADSELNILLDKYSRLVPGLVPFVEEALQPYIQALAESEKDYFFQPEERVSKEAIRP